MHVKLRGARQIDLSGHRRAPPRRGAVVVVGLALAGVVVLLVSAVPTRLRLTLADLPFDSGGREADSVGKPAPEFALDLLDGGSFRLSEQGGRAVVVNFWASWCIPCRAETLRISYPVGLDLSNEIAVRYQVLGLPTTVFIARDGTMARKWNGPLSEQELVAFVREIAER